MNGLDDLRKGDKFGIDYKFGSKDLDLSTKIGDMPISGSIGYDGTFKASASKPFLGGNLTLNGSKNGDSKNAYLQFQRSF